MSDEKQSPPVSVSPMAQPFLVAVTLTVADFKARLDEYWEQVKDLIDPNVLKHASRGGFRPGSPGFRAKVVELMGGDSTFYQKVIYKTIRDFVDTKPHNSIMSYDSMSMEETDGKYLVRAIVFYEPEVTLASPVNSGIAGPYEVEVSKFDRTAKIAERLDLHVKNIKLQHAVFKPRQCGPSDTPKDGDLVLVSFTTILPNGQVWPEATAVNRRAYVDPKALRWDVIYDTIKRAHVGEVLEFSGNLPDDVPVHGGESVTGTLTVTSIMDQEPIEITNDLALSAGYENLNHMETSLKSKCERSVDRERTAEVMKNLLVGLSSNSSVGPMPNGWINAMVESRYAAERKKFNTEQEMLTAYNALSKDHLLQSLRYDVALSASADLLLRAWGVARGYDPKPNGKSIQHVESMAAYVNMIEQHIMELVTLKEV